MDNEIIKRVNIKFVKESRKNDRFFMILILAHLPFTALIIPWFYGTLYIGIIASAIIAILSVLTFFFVRGTLFAKINNGLLLMAISATMISTSLGKIEMHFHLFGALSFLIIYKDTGELLFQP